VKSGIIPLSRIKKKPIRLALSKYNPPSQYFLFDSGIITAFRFREYGNDKNILKEYTNKENEHRTKHLLAKLIQKYGVTKVKGAYIENFGTPKAKEVGESVFFVIDINETGNFCQFTYRSGQFIVGRGFYRDNFYQINNQF